MALAYRGVSRPPAGEAPVEVAPGVTVPEFVRHYAERGQYEARRFFTRLEPWLNVSGKTVLDVGCGAGYLCHEAARRGATRVVGVDIDADYVALGLAQLEAQGLDSRVALKQYAGHPSELAGEYFDVVLSKDSVEHYGAHASTPTAESIIEAMGGLLRPGGQLAIGFGPLWNAPYGGHIDSWLPWAHLIFPEEVIFDEFRRVRPPGKTARTFAEGVGVNRMTLARFMDIMDHSGLQCVHLATNVSNHPAVGAMNVLRRVPALREYMTQNIYGVWQSSATAHRDDASSGVTGGELHPPR
jgi:2-polyprenyl-3-methyl-5-hydroxy-6-metoxy-1,4-benzoquinol methylase